MELDCSRAVVGFLKEKGVLTGGEDGLCLSDLKSLPKINVGLGSNTFPLGNADQFNVSAKTRSNLQTIQEVLMGKNARASVSFTGYADGEQNNISQFDSRFLKSGETTFSKIDLKNKITDVNSLKALLDLLKSYPEDAKIPYDQSRPELKTAQSLIRNYYLARDRASKVCETTMPAGSNCDNSSIAGYASPYLETHGNKQCGARRRAFMTFDLSPSGMSKSKFNNGRFSPHFESPNPLEYQRDLQIAASADLLAKLSKQSGGNDFSKYLEGLEVVLPRECASNPDVVANVKDNTKRLLKDLDAAMGKVSDAAFKTAVARGDYKAIKKSLDFLNDKEDSQKPLSVEEQAKKKVLEIVTTGVDRSAPRNFKVQIANNSKYKNGKDIESFTRTLPDGTIETLKAHYLETANWGNKVLLYTNSNEKFLVDFNAYKSFTYKWKSGTDRLIQVLPPDKRESPEFAISLVDADYPKATEATTPSTDAMNCFSVSKAIEENLSENDNALVDASLLVGGEQAKLDLSLNSAQVAHLDGDKKNPQGWACTRCYSGVTIGETGAMEYKARDWSQPKSAYNSVKGQHDSNSLTIGSLKNMKVFNISRDAFNGSCPESKSVCDCVKEQGELDKLLAHSTTQKISLLGDKPTLTYKNGNGGNSYQWKQTWTLPKPENHCVFTPPVPHTCQVDPKGRSKEVKSSSRADIAACKILENIKTKYQLTSDIDVNKYKNVVLGASICKKSLPTAEEAKDCGLQNSSGSKSSSGNASKQ